MKINLYDFDGTIYDGDSTFDFIKYEIKRHPIILITLFEDLLFALLYILHIVNKTKMKEHFYKFLRLIKNIDEEVISFWRVHDKNIKKFYLDKRHDQDIIISASPEFLLKPIANKLKVKDLIASRVDKNTGKTTGLNCHDVEKVRRLDEKYEDYKVIEAYSDSIKSDKPILDLAKRAYLVKKDNISIIK
jgi:HAD superfamily phosphoserine phosphatase-like hydrolase